MPEKGTLLCIELAVCVYDGLATAASFSFPVKRIHSREERMPVNWRPQQHKRRTIDLAKLGHR